VVQTAGFTGKEKIKYMSYKDPFQLEKPNIKQVIHEKIDKLFWLFMRSQTNITKQLKPEEIVDLKKPEIEVWKDNLLLLKEPFNIRYLGCVERIKTVEVQHPPDMEHKKHAEHYRVWKFLDKSMEVVFEYDEECFCKGNV
jgi:hypothetical protein